MSNSNFEFDTMSMDEDAYKLFKMMGMHGDDLSDVEDEAKTLLINTTDYGDYGCLTRVVAPCSWFESEDDFRDKIKTQFYSQIKAELDSILVDSMNTVCELIDVMGMVGFKSYITYTDVVLDDPEIEKYKSAVKMEVLRNLYIYMFFKLIMLDVEDSDEFYDRATEISGIVVIFAS